MNRADYHAAKTKVCHSSNRNNSKIRGKFTNAKAREKRYVEHYKKKPGMCTNQQALCTGIRTFSQATLSLITLALSAIFIFVLTLVLIFGGIVVNF